VRKHSLRDPLDRSPQIAEAPRAITEQDDSPTRVSTSRVTGHAPSCCRNSVPFLHGLQIFVNLSARNKLTAPEAIRLERSEVPEWRNDAGDRVRIVVGSFENVASPLVPSLVPSEPFNLLDVELQFEIYLNLQNAHNAVVYVPTGDVLVRADSREPQVTAENALTVGGTGGRATFEAVH
jgi:redox-sensitive bicupin YhaK (pirin superfamily)